MVEKMTEEKLQEISMRYWGKGFDDLSFKEIIELRNSMCIDMFVPKEIWSEYNAIIKSRKMRPDSILSSEESSNKIFLVDCDYITDKTYMIMDKNVSQKIRDSFWKSFFNKELKSLRKLFSDVEYSVLKKNLEQRIEDTRKGKDVDDSSYTDSDYAEIRNKVIPAEIYNKVIPKEGIDEMLEMDYVGSIVGCSDILGVYEVGDGLKFLNLAYVKMILSWFPNVVKRFYNKEGPGLVVFFQGDEKKAVLCHILKDESDVEYILKNI